MHGSILLLLPPPTCIAHTIAILHVEFAERGTEYGILFIVSLFCEYIHLEYVRFHVIYRVRQAECVMHILAVTLQEYMNIYSTRRIAIRLHCYCAVYDPPLTPLTPYHIGNGNIVGVNPSCSSTRRTNGRKAAPHSINIYLYLYISISISVSISIYLSIHIYISIYLSIYLSIYIYVYIYIYIYIYLSILGLTRSIEARVKR